MRLRRDISSYDPMFAPATRMPGAVWLGGGDLLPLGELENLGSIEPEAPQANQHVMDYWDWRLDGLANGVTRRMRKG